jgi:hypothetical protein
VYLNGAWSATAPITNLGSNFFNLVEAPSGQDLFVFQSANSPGATWLSP